MSRIARNENITSQGVRYRIHSNGAGISTGCPSTTPFGLALGPPNPGTINVAQETLDLRRAGFSPAYDTLLIPTFSLPYAPTSVTENLHCIWNAPLPLYLAIQAAASVHVLSPVTSSAQSRSTSELLRTL